MSYSLDNFCDDTRSILMEGDDHESRERVRQKLELLLVDEDFCAKYVGPNNDPGVKQLVEDPDASFCVLSYNTAGARTSPPHDHGESWAVYGQTSGYTDMTVWSAASDSDDKIEPVRTFRLEPGQAGLFDIREIHSIQYPAGAKFIRVTGVDMSKTTRRVFDPKTGAVREIEHVGTGDTND